eukprot:jgi/Phyca11/102315/e_gw1.6.219.1
MTLSVRRTRSTVPLLLLASIASILLSTVYINSRLLGNQSVGLSDSFDSFQGRTYSVNGQQEANVALTGINQHPVALFYHRGTNFDVSVSRDRAVLICMHDGVLDMGLSLIRELRCLGNKELIQVYHCGRDELTDQSIQLIFRLDDRVELVDEMAMEFRSWWIKPLAMYHTDVRHVMMLDVDDVILKNPAIVRDLDGYVATGTTFFYDRVVHKHKFLNGNDHGRYYLRRLLLDFNYDKFNVTKGFDPSDHVVNSFAYQGKSCHEMDSSMVLIDKERAGQVVMDIILWFITEERFRFKYSWGDKETFWLAFEMAHKPYFFSPWGVSVVDSVPNEDLERHPDTLCGSILQFLPDKTDEAEVLYINGKALIDPYPQGVGYIRKAKQNNLFNLLPTQMTPRQHRQEVNSTAYPRETFHIECMVGMGSTPLPNNFRHKLLRRRLHFFGISMDVLESLQHCETYEKEI